MTPIIVRIVIKKILPAGTYAYGQMENIAFASEYLIQTEAELPSPELCAYARNLAAAESRLLPDCIRFERAQIKLVMPGAEERELRSQFTNVALPDLRGQWKLEAGDTLAFPPVTAIYGRQANRGAHGRLNFPYAITTAEWNVYTQTQESPERFAKRSAFDHSSVSSFFSQQLIEAVSEAGGQHVMVSTATSTNVEEFRPRSITNFYFKELQVPGKPKSRKNAKARQNAALRRARLQSNKDGTDFDAEATLAAIKSQGKSKKSRPSEGIVYLLKAGPHYKIGKSVNFEKRLTQIKLQLPHAVEVIHVIHAADHSRAESYWHRRFAARRLNGEWFELSEAEVAEFKGVLEMPLIFD